MNRIKKALRERSIKKLPEDLFIRRLRSLVIGEGMLHDGNIYLIDFALKNMPKNGHVLEIGSYGGLSTSLTIHLLKKNKRTERLINCDPWIYEGFKDAVEGETLTIDGREDVTRTDYSAYMKGAFINNMKLLNKEELPFSFQLTSDEFFSKYTEKLKEEDLFGRELQLGAPLSFAYIDGNHAYDYVKRDFNNVDKFLLKSGYILFDDSMDDMQFGSAVFMKEMKANPNYKFIDKNPNYLFQKLS